MGRRGRDRCVAAGRRGCCSFEKVRRNCTAAAPAISRALPAEHITLTRFDQPVISPDGRRVARTGLSEGRRHLWIRQFDSSMDRLPGTDGAMLPFWSPDSRSLAFFADSKLKRIDATGGT